MTSNYTNQSYASICHVQILSVQKFKTTRIFNSYLTILIVIIGLVGNSFAVLVFSHKKYRKTSTSVYLLCLAISDCMFLINHFMDDLLKASEEDDTSINHMLIHNSCRIYELNKSRHLNKTISPGICFLNKFCKLFKFFNYYFQFVSAYIIVAFTIQRTIALSSPFRHLNLESQKQYRAALSTILIAAFVGACPFPFFFRNETTNGTVQYCTVDSNYFKVFFQTRAFYIVFVTALPSVIILACNLLSLFHVCLSNKQRKEFINASSSMCKQQQFSIDLENTRVNLVVKRKVETRLNELNSIFTPNRSQEHNLNLLIHTKSKQINQEKKVSKMLIIMSLSHVSLNMPYSLTWLFLYRELINQSNGGSAFDEHRLIVNSINLNYWYATFHVAEIFYVLNFGVHFFVYCVGGQIFRTHMKDLYKSKSLQLNENFENFYYNFFFLNCQAGSENRGNRGSKKLSNRTANFECVNLAIDLQ